MRWRSLVCGLLSGLLAGGAGANPQGGTVVHGSATWSQTAPGLLEIHSGANAILHWSSFSIGHGETTRFVLPDSLASVLNRVTGNDPSALMGSLLANGRVFLINPNGIVFGPNSVIDTGSLVASTLDMSDADFLAGRLRFMTEGEAGDIANRGLIQAAPGGQVLLVAPRVENEGAIIAEGGRILLAAGRSVSIASFDSPDVEFEVQAPGDEVVNLGRLQAGGGAIDVFAGTLRHSGEIRADTVSVAASGRVTLRASADITLADGSLVSASGAPGGVHDGGEVRIVAERALDMRPGAEVRVDGGVDGGDGGFLELSGREAIRLDGDYTGAARADGYRHGALLIDPTDIEIAVTAGASVSVSGLGFNDYLGASSPDGSRIYVSMRGGENKVAVIDVASNTVIAEVTLSGVNPGAVGVSPDGSRLYVANEATGNVSVVDTGALSEIGTIAVGAAPRFLLLSDDGSRAYVSNRGASDTVSVIDTASGAFGAVIATVSVGDDPGHMAFSIDGGTLYVANEAGDSLSVIDVGDLGAAPVTVSDAALNGAFTVVAHTDSARVYVSGIGSDEVAVVDTATNTVSGAITVGDGPYFMDLVRDGSSNPKLYVSNLHDGSVSVIDTTGDTIATTIGGLGGFVRLAVSADGERAYVASESASQVHVIDTDSDSVLRTFTATDGVVVPVVSAIGNRVAVPQWDRAEVFVIGSSVDPTGGDGIIASGDPPAGTLQVDPSSLAGSWSSVELQATNDITVLDPIRGSDLPGVLNFNLYALNDIVVDAAIGTATSPIENVNLEAVNDVFINNDVHVLTRLEVKASESIHITGAMLQTHGPASDIILSGDFDSSGAGNVVITDSHLQSNGMPVAVLFAQGTGSGSASERAGVYVDNSTVEAIGVGGARVLMLGVGFAAGDSPGVDIVNGSVLRGTAGVTLTGIGGDTATPVSDNPGVRVTGAGTQVAASGTGSIHLDGTGGSTLGARNYGVVVGSGAEVVAVDGSVSIDGTAGDGSEQNSGVDITGTGTRVHSTGSGNITVTGVASGTTTDNRGIYLANEAVIEASASGIITLDGIGGGASGNDNYGVRITDAGTEVRALNPVSILGQGGDGDGQFNTGISVGSDALVTSTTAVYLTGTGGDGAAGSAFGVDISRALVSATGIGSVTLDGTGGGIGNRNTGVVLEGPTSPAMVLVSSVNGDIDITGAGGGDGTGQSNRGVSVSAATEVLATGAGSITIDGTGGDGTRDNMGVIVRDSGTRIAALGGGGGGVTIDGTGAGAGDFSMGVDISGGAAIAATAGAVTVRGSGSDLGTDNNGGVGIGGAGTTVSADDTVTITGFGGDSATANGGAGVEINNAAVSSISGIVVAGTGGDGATGFAYGTIVGGGAQVSGSGSAGVSVTGTGGGIGPSNRGVRIQDFGTLISVVDGNLSVTADGGGDGSANGNQGILMTNFSEIRSSGAGNIVIDADAGLGTDDNAAFAMADAGTLIRSTGSGAIDITGNGEGSAGNNEGIDIWGGAVVESTGSGGIVLTGAGSLAGTDDNEGVHISDAGTLVRSTGGGAIDITGTANGSVGDNNDGISINTGAQIIAAGAADVTLRGTSRSGASRNAGVKVTDAGTVVSSEDGTTFLNGIGRGSADLNDGLSIGAALVQATGSGRVTLFGSTVTTPGTDSNAGVRLWGGARAESVSGLINIQGNAGGSGDFNHGIDINDGSDIVTTGSARIVMSGNGAGTARGINVSDPGTQIGGPSTTGDILLKADTASGTDAINLGTATVQGSGFLRLRPNTADTSIGLAGGAGVFNVSSAELGGFVDGFAGIEVGLDSFTTGPITVGSHTFTDPLTLISGGDIDVSGSLDTSDNDLYFNTLGTVDIGADIDTGAGSIDTTFGSGLVSFYSSSTLSAASFSAYSIDTAGASVALDVDISISDLIVSGGDLTATGNIDIDGLFDWSAGVLGGGGTTTVTSTGRLDMSGLPKEIDGGTLRVESASGSTWTGGDLGFRDGGRFELAGPLELSADASMPDLSAGGSIFIDSTGRLSKTGGGGTSQVGPGAVTFDVDGEVSVTSGTLAMLGGGAGTNTGNFDARGGGLIIFAGGTWDFGDGAVISGPGTQFLGGSTDITLSGTGVGTTIASDATLTMSSRAIGGAGNLVNAGTLDVSDGGNSLPGMLTNTASGEVIITGTDSSDGFLDVAGAISNAGTITLTNDEPGVSAEIESGSVGGLVNSGIIDAAAGAGGGERKISGGALTNTAAGTLVASGALLVVDSGGAAIGEAPSNAGIVRASGGDIEFNDHPTLTHSGGSLEIGAGRALTVADGDLVWEGGAIDAGAGGTLAFSGAGLVLGGSGARVLDGVNLAFTDLALTAGSLELRSATLTDSGSPVIGAGTSLLLSGSGATIDNSGPLTVAGSLAGNGTITGDLVVDGTLAAGASPGHITVLGSYTHGPAATMLVEIAGITRGVEYDWLEVLGTVSLDGTLRVSEIDGFAPFTGDTFDFLSYGAPLVGDFALVDAPGGYSWGDLGSFYRLDVESGLSPRDFSPIDAGIDVFGPIVSLEEDTWLSPAVTGSPFDDADEGELRETALCR